MEFSGQYLTYEEYKALGGTLDIMPFNLLEFEARKKIDASIQNRLKNVQEIPQEIKLCEYELINKINSYLKVSSSIGNVSSENIDGYSVSYVTADRVSDISRSKKSELNDIIITYLTGVIVNNEHILYLGVK